MKVCTENFEKTFWQLLLTVLDYSEALQVDERFEQVGSGSQYIQSLKCLLGGRVRVIEGLQRVTREVRMGIERAGCLSLISPASG